MTSRAALPRRGAGGKIEGSNPHPERMTATANPTPDHPFFAVIGYQGEAMAQHAIRIVPVRAADVARAIRAATERVVGFRPMGARSLTELREIVAAMQAVHVEIGSNADAFYVTTASHVDTPQAVIESHAVAAPNMGFAVANVLQGRAERVLLSVESFATVFEQLQLVTDFARGRA